MVVQRRAQRPVGSRKRLVIAPREVAPMPTQVDDLYAEKQSIIDELFIKTADDNYVTARWCFHQNLNVDFFWLAVHCVEKYLKAVLLFNGRTAKLKHGHDISKLYADVLKFADDL